MSQTTQRPGPRIHRLPRRLDYLLTPAPLDLSLDAMTEKSPLPAIIVTPCSPAHSKDFAIAFLAPPKKPSLTSRLSSYFAGGASTAVSAIPKWASSSSPSSLWSRIRSSPSIALPISAPATTTEFPAFTAPSNSVTSYYNSNNDISIGNGNGTPRAKRNSRILVVVLAVFMLVFMHMVAHFFAYASTKEGVGRTMTSATLRDGNNLSSSGDAYTSYWNGLEIHKWMGWISKADSAAGDTIGGVQVAA